MLYSVHNPIFKKNLLFSLISYKLIGLKFHFLGDLKNENKSFLKFPYRQHIVELNFSNGTKLDISYGSPRYIEVRESSTSGIKYCLFPNENNSMRMIGETKGNFVDYVNIIGGADDLKEIMNSKEKIQDVQLIKQPSDRINHPRVSNVLQVNGICLIFNSIKFFIYNYNGSALKFNKRSQEIENGDLVLSSEFMEYGKQIKKYFSKGLMIPKIDFKKDWIITRSELEIPHTIDVYDIKNMKPNQVFIQEVIQGHSIEQLEEHLDFLTLLKNDLISKQYGIAELKFGLNSDTNFRLVTPIDVVEPLAENIIFIDNIIETIDDLKSTSTNIKYIK